MAFDTKNLNAYDFIQSFRQTLGDTLQERLESGELFPLLEARESRSFDSRDAAEEFAKANKKLNPSKPAQSSKSGKWTIVVDAKVADHGFGKNSNKVASLKEEYVEEDESLDEHVRKDTTDIDWTLLSDEERNVVLKVRELGRHLGSDPGAYASGVLLLTFKNKQAVEDFATALENEDMVDTYEIEAAREDLVHGFVEDGEYDFGDIMFDKDFEFNVYVYLVPEIVSFSAEELEVGDDFEWDDDEGNGFMMEVRRRIKVNFRGKKRIKMQCRPGFKWEAAAKTCQKITGAQVAVMRKAMRRAVLTKKAMGQSFKARVVRKTRKARRFRKSFGLG